MSSGRTMPIRRWVSVLIAGLFLAPILTIGVIGFILFAPTEGPVFPAEEAATRISDDADRWSDPDWRQSTEAWLTGESMDVVLMSNGEIVWKSSETPERIDDRTTHVEEVSADQTFILFAPNQEGPPEQLTRWFVPLAMLATLTITVLAIAWFLRRSFVEPLTATSEAAQQLAAGSYDVEIPESRVREVNELAASFEAMRDSLRTSINRQVAVEEERRFLISAVAHDLRTPLFALRGSLEGLIHGIANTDAKREQYLQIALKRANDLELLISDLFAWSRMELAGLEPQRERCSLTNLLETAADGIRPRADARDIAIIRTGPDAELKVDASMFHRALDNVLDNALTHSPDSATIEIVTKLEPGNVVISIRDEGPGIPNDELEIIFTPMYRGEDSRNRQTGGAGLGLNVARRIVEVHGGTIRARNHAEGGAVFEIRLPVAES